MLNDLLLCLALVSPKAYVLAQRGYYGFAAHEVFGLTDAMPKTPVREALLCAARALLDLSEAAWQS